MNKPHWAYVSKEKYSQSESILILISAATQCTCKATLLWQSLIRKKHLKR